MSGKGERPTGIIILSTILVIGAVLYLLGAAAFGILGAFGFSSVVSALSGFGTAALVILAVLLLITAYGFWKGTKWGWWLGIIVAGLSIISIIALSLVTFVIGIIMVYYLTRPYVRRWFGV